MIDIFQPIDNDLTFTITEPSNDYWVQPNIDVFKFIISSLYDNNTLCSYYNNNNELYIF